MVPLAKFDISLNNTPPGLAPFCTESWQRFPPIFFSISLAPTNKVVRVHTKNYGKTRKTKGIYRKTRNLCGGESVGNMYAMEWNVPCTVLFNDHTCFQPTVSISVTYLIYDDSACFKHRIL